MRIGRRGGCAADVEQAARHERRREKRGGVKKKKRKKNARAGEYINILQGAAVDAGVTPLDACTRCSAASRRAVFTPRLPFSRAPFSPRAAGDFTMLSWAWLSGTRGGVRVCYARLDKKTRRDNDFAMFTRRVASYFFDFSLARDGPAGGVCRLRPTNPARRILVAEVNTTDVNRK